MLKELKYLIYDVREQTDNRDENGVKDREFVRYFNDGVKTIQAMIFKNNPLCKYYQASAILTPSSTPRVYDLPADVFGDNAITLVEVKSDSRWRPLDQVWPEDGDAFLGWFTRNKQLYISGDQDRAFDGTIRVWYFKRLYRFDKVWATVASTAGQNITLSDVDAELFKIDTYLTIVSEEGVQRASVRYKKVDDTTVTVTGEISTVVAGDLVLLGKNATLTLDMPEECEPYLMDYVAQRVAGRNSYGEDWNKLNFWTTEERSNIIAIFADASQAEVRAPITDTEYLRI